MKVDPKSVLLANSAWFVLIGGVGLGFLTDKMMDGYAVDLKGFTPRETFIHQLLMRITGLHMGFLGMIPLFSMAAAKPQTLKNLCFAMGVVNVMTILNHFARNHAFLIEKGVKGQEFNNGVSLLLAIASFAGADFAMPSCRLADVAWGPVEMFIAVTALMWGPSCYFFPGKVMEAYKLSTDGVAGEWMTCSAAFLGFVIILVAMVCFVLFASKDAGATRKFVQLNSMYMGVSLGFVAGELAACGPMEIDQGPLLFNALVWVVGLFCCCRAAEASEPKQLVK